MKTLTIEIPETVGLSVSEARNLLAAKLYERGNLSLGQAAEMAGYSKRAFMEMLHLYGVSLFNYSVEDLEQDIENVRRYNEAV